MIFHQKGISGFGGYPKKTSHPEKMSVSEVWVIFRGSSRISAISGQSPIARIGTLSFGPWSTKLGQTDRATKKNKPHYQRIWSRPELRRSGRFYVLPKSKKRAENPSIFQKETPDINKEIKTDIYLGKWYIFFRNTLPSRG